VHQLPASREANGLDFCKYLQNQPFVLFLIHGVFLLWGDSMKANRILKAWSVDTILILTFFAWSWMQDWVRVEDWTRNGKMLATVAAAGVAAAVYTCKRFHWSVGLFLSFTVLRWVSLRLAPISMIEVTMVVACVFLAIFIHQKDVRNLLGNCLVVDAFLQSTLGLCEVAGFFPFLQITNSVVWPPIAAHGHPTILGPYLAVSLAFIPGAFRALKQWPRARDAARAVCFAVILACIGFTQSTMTMVTLAVAGILAIGFYCGTRAMAAAGAGVVAIGAGIIKLYPSAGSFSGRIPAWEFAWNNLTLLGHGAGTWFPISFQMKMNEVRAAGGSAGPVQFFGQLHNDWLQGVFEWGWLGMAPLFFGMIVLFTITLKAILLRRRELFPYAVLFWGLAANAFGNFIIHTMPAGGLLAIGAIYLFQYDFDEEPIRRHFERMERNL